MSVTILLYYIVLHSNIKNARKNTYYFISTTGKLVLEARHTADLM